MAKRRARVGRQENGVYLVEIEEEKRRKFRPVDLIPWCALIVSFGSLWFSIDQGMESRRHDRLSLLPAVTVSHYGRMGEDFGIVLKNTGVGPAVIKSLDGHINNQYFVEVESLRNTLCSKYPFCRELYAEAGSTGQQIVRPKNRNLTYSSFESNHVLEMNVPMYLIQVTGVDIPERAEMWTAISTKHIFELRVTYCSVYGECFVACVIRPVEECKAWEFKPPR
jgi:hypothetical protein